MSQESNRRLLIAGVVGAFVLVAVGVYLAQPEQYSLDELRPVDDHRAVIVFQTYDEDAPEELAMIDTRTKGFVWRRDAPAKENHVYSPDTLVSSLAVSQDHGVVVVLASRLDGYPATVTGISLETGETRWERKLPMAGNRKGLGLEVRGDVVLTLSTSYGLRALNVTDGAPLWDVEEGETIDAYTVHEGHVIVWNALEVAHVRDLKTGEIQASLSDAGPNTKPRFSHALCLREGALTWLVDTEVDTTKQLMTLDLKTYARTPGPYVEEEDLGVGFWTRCATYGEDLVFSGWVGRGDMWMAHFARVDPETGKRKWLTKLEGAIGNPLFLEPTKWVYMNAPITRYVPVLALMGNRAGDNVFEGSVLDVDTGAVHTKSAKKMGTDRFFYPYLWRLAGTPWWVIQARDDQKQVLAVFDGERGELVSSVKTKALLPASLYAQGDTFWMYGYGSYVRHDELGWYTTTLPSLDVEATGTETALEPGGDWVQGWFGGK